MNKIVAHFSPLGAALWLIGCATYPELPPLQGQAAIVLGYSTEQARPYEGGTLYTGFHLKQVDDMDIEPLTQYSVYLLAPGEHRLRGDCYWQWRGLNRQEDDFSEPGELTLLARADHVYTLQSDLDEYKHQCRLTVIERAEGTAR